MVPNLPAFQVSWPYYLFFVSSRPMTPVILLCPSLPFSQVETRSGMSPFQATPLTCPKLSLRDLIQLGQICIAGFMTVQLGKRVLA